MIVERVTDTLIMATIIVIIISGNGFIEITLRLYFIEISASLLEGRISSKLKYFESLTMTSCIGYTETGPLTVY
jgi:hypothetical protein